MQPDLPLDSDLFILQCEQMWLNFLLTFAIVQLFALWLRGEGLILLFDRLGRSSYDTDVAVFRDLTHFALESIEEF